MPNNSYLINDKAKETFNAPDLKAKRFRKKRKTTLNKTFFEQFRASQRKVSMRAAGLGDADIRTILAVYHQVVRETVIHSTDGVLLHDRTGHLYITACPPKKTPNINYAQSIAQGRLVQHVNLHTDGLVCKINYSSDLPGSFRNRDLWSFEPIRPFQKEASLAFPQQFTRYRRPSPQHTISRRERRQARTAYIVAKKLPAYDEFA